MGGLVVGTLFFFGLPQFFLAWVVVPGPCIPKFEH